MSGAATAPLWERSILRDTAGITLRPGGFALTDRGVSLARLEHGAHALDVGCGLGATVEHLRIDHNLEACGIDNSARQLSEAPSHLPLTLAHASCIPFANHAFDAIFCECVLSLLPDLDQTIEEFRRVLKTNGKMIISDLYQRTREKTPQVSCSCASSPLDLKKTEAILSKHGMRITSLEDHSKLLAELAARLIFAGEPDFRLTGNCCRRPGYMLLIAEIAN